MTGTERKPDYDVGYKKPPKASQFKKGQSGNPKGRPKGSRNKQARTLLAPGKLDALILQECYREVEVKEGNRHLTMSAAQLTLRSLTARAAKGDFRSQRLFTELLQATEAREQAAKEEHFETMLQYKLHWEKVLRDREERGLPPPDPMPMPHPADVYVNPRTGECAIRGPMSEDEAEAFDQLKERCLSLLEEIGDLRKRLRRSRSEKKKAMFKSDLDRTEAHLERLLDGMDTFKERFPRLWPLQDLEMWRVRRTSRRRYEEERGN